MRLSSSLLCLAVGCLFAAPASARQVTGLVAQYRLDETAGTTLVDSGPAGHDGTWQGGYTLGQPGAATGTGNSVALDPLQQGYGSVPNAPDLAALSADLSVAAWMYPLADGANGIMRVFGNNDGAWSCGRKSNGLRFTTRYVQDYDIPASVPLGQWTHVAFVFDANYDVTFYVNGAAVGTVAGNAPAQAATSEWRLGSLNSNIEYWDGRLDDVQVYAGTLTAQDVLWLYQHPGQAIGSFVGMPFCFGDGSGALCPCANAGAPGEGCAHSGGVGARLEGTGTPSAIADDLVLTARALPPGGPAILFAARNALAGGAGVPFGDGLRCAGGHARRFALRVADPAGDAAWGPGLGAAGGWAPGDVRRLQVWFADPAGVCGTGFNLSAALEVAFVP